jgi:hypothetical protein
LSKVRDALGGRDSASLEMHLEAVIERDWSDALGGQNCVGIAIHFEAVNERVWRCAWRPSSSEIGRVVRRGQSGGGSS